MDSVDSSAAAYTLSMRESSLGLAKGAKSPEKKTVEKAKAASTARPARRPGSRRAAEDIGAIVQGPNSDVHRRGRRRADRFSLGDCGLDFRLVAMSSRGRAVLASLALVVFFALPLLPEILGARRLIFRDAQITHWPWRRVAMEALASGQVPFVNARASGGEPLLANPNAVLLYPTLLLEKVLPAAAAFNLHYLLHVLWAFFGARLLARRLRQSEGAAFLAGVAFAFSGMMLSYASAFANSSAAASWLPWCAAAALGLSRAAGWREVLARVPALSLALGLQLLAGEPAISLLTAGLCVGIGVARSFARPDGSLAGTGRFLAAAGASGVGAAAFAAPLVLPLLQILPLTYRGQHVYSERAFFASPFSLWRCLEWLFPRFSGDPGALGAGGHWQHALHRGRPRLHLVRDVRGDSPAARPSRRPLPGLLEGRRALARRRRGRLAAARVRLRAPLLPLAGGGRSAAPPALSDQVLPADDAVRRASGGIRGGPADGAQAPTARRPRPGNGGAALRDRRRGRAGGRAARAAGPAAPPGTRRARPGAPARPFARTFTVDALLGLAAVAVVASILYWRPRAPGAGYLLGFAVLFFALPWGLPLFVTADEKDLAAAAGPARGDARKRPALRLTAAAGVQRPRHGHRAPGPAAARLEARARPDRRAHPGHRRNVRRALPLRRGPGRIVRLLQPTRRRGVQRLDGRRAQPAPARLRRPLDPGGRGRGVPAARGRSRASPWRAGGWCCSSSRARSRSCAGPAARSIGVRSRAL